MEFILAIVLGAIFVFLWIGITIQSLRHVSPNREERKIEIQFVLGFYLVVGVAYLLLTLLSETD